MAENSQNISSEEIITAYQNCKNDAERSNIFENIRKNNEGLIKKYMSIHREKIKASAPNTNIKELETDLESTLYMALYDYLNEYTKDYNPNKKVNKLSTFVFKCFDNHISSEYPELVNLSIDDMSEFLQDDSNTGFDEQLIDKLDNGTDDESDFDDVPPANLNPGSFNTSFLNYLTTKEMAIIEEKAKLDDDYKSSKNMIAQIAKRLNKTEAYVSQVWERVQRIAALQNKQN